jgi:hypothetical protein
MIDIRRLTQAVTDRLGATWQRLSTTQRLTLRGVGIVGVVLALAGLAGMWGPKAVATADDELGYTGTAIRSQFGLLRQSLDTTAGELELTRIELRRLEAIVDFSKRYAVPAGMAELVYETALKQGVDPELAFRLVKLESGFRPTARSHAGAIGLAQVQLATARYYDETITIERLHDPETNLRIGLRFLRDLLNAYGDVELALLAYNWGPTRLKELLAQGRNPRNGYASSIMDGYAGTW